MHVKTIHRIQSYIPLLCGFLTSGTIVMLIHRYFPMAGHDYRFFIPRLIDTKLHVLLNGLTIQWYSPSFGGGLPAFPNPQHIEYSFIQLLTVITDPWTAVLVSTFFVSMAGFVVFRHFLEKTLGLHWTSSTLGAIFFAGNGFFIEHMIVGHIGYQLFPLGVVILYAMVDRRLSLLTGSLTVALVAAMMVHQGGFYIIGILALSFLITLPLVRIRNPDALDSKLTLQKIVLGLVVAGILASSKIYAVLSLMQLFPRHISNVYTIGLPQAIMGMVAQLLGVMFLAPFLLLGGQDPSLLSGALANITGAQFGIWETDLGLSPVLTVLLLFGLARQISLVRKVRLSAFNFPKHIVSWLILILGIWVTTEMAAANGVIYPFIKQLPILISMHVNVRFAAAFILPLVLLGAWEFEKLTFPHKRMRPFLIAAGFSIPFLLVYCLLPADVHSRFFDLSRSLQTNAAIERGERFVVAQVIDSEDEEVFLAYATNLLEYEALYSENDPVKGYNVEAFNSRVQVQPGGVTIRDGEYFNITNPASLVFPEENGLQPFERIKVDDEDELQAFVERRQPRWKLPVLQVILNWLSLAAFILSVGLVGLPTVLGWIHQTSNRTRWM
jgi:hypothetical protein